MSPTDAWLRRAKVRAARRIVTENATTAVPRITAWEDSICEPEGPELALDFDTVICCVGWYEELPRFNEGRYAEHWLAKPLA